MSHVPYYNEQAEADSDLWGLFVDEPSLFANEDILNQSDTVSLEELEPSSYDQMSRAGIDDLTATDDFINMNGDTRYVTDLYPEG